MNRLARLLEGRTRFGLVAGGLMWVIWAVGSVLGPGNLDLNGQVIGTDHSAFHTAAVLLREGRGDSLFEYPELRVFQARQEELVGKAGFLDPYRNPPYYALLYLPTARLPYLGSYGVWALLGLFGLVAGLALARGPRLLTAVGWSLSYYPVFAAVSFGQNTLLSFAAFGLVYRCLALRQRFLAGLAAGLLLYKPQLLFGIGVWWLLEVRWYGRCLIGLGVAGLILAGISAAVVPAETAEWVRKLPDIARYDAFDFFNLHNPRGFGALLLGRKSAGNWFGLAGMGLAVLWMVRAWRRHAADLPVMFAVAVFATLWGSPHTMTYEWALAVLPAVILWDARPDLRADWVPLFAIAWAVMFVSTPLAKAQLQATGVAIQLSVPVLAFVGWRAERILRRPRAPG